MEYNPVEQECVCDGFMGIEGVKIADLKKTDAFKFEYDAGVEERVKLDEWMESRVHDDLREVIEQEIESKMNVGGIR